MTDQTLTSDASRQRPRKGPSEIENKIFALLKSLPDLKLDISEEHCRAYANSLNGSIVMARMNYQRAPAQQRVGAKATQAELSKLSRHGNKLAQTLSDAHLEANTLIQRQLPEGISLSTFKRELSEILLIIYKAADAADALTEKGAKPSDQYVANVTLAAGNVFKALTGREPNRTVNGITGKSGGPFLEFLAQLFAILGIKANAEYQARQQRTNRS